MKTHLLSKFASVAFFIFGLLIAYFVLPLAFTSGLLAMLAVVFLSSILLIAGTFVLCGFSLRFYIKSLALGGCAELLVGLVFLTPFSLEIKLLAINIFLVITALTIRYSAKWKIKRKKDE